MDFDLDSLSSCSLSDLKPGDFYLLTGYGARAASLEFVACALQAGAMRRIRVQDQEWRSYPMPEDETDLSCLRIAKRGRLKISLPDGIHTEGPTQALGSLYVNRESVYVLVANAGHDRGDALRLINLRDWTTREYEPRGFVTFAKWKLVAVDDEGNEVALLERIPPAELAK